MKTRKIHRHQAKKTITRCYDHPVAEHENPSAHGGVCEISTCACGAVRMTNKNGPHTERGPWTGTGITPARQSA